MKSWEQNQQDQVPSMLAFFFFFLRAIIGAHFMFSDGG